MPQIGPIASQQNSRCWHCSLPMVRHRHRDGTPVPPNAMTRDHLTPHTYGGGNGSNIVAACCRCNELRGDMDAVAFRNLIRRLFARDPGLPERWHQLSPEELYAVRLRCLYTHEELLRGRAKSCIEHAFRHFQLLSVFPHYFQA